MARTTTARPAKKPVRAVSLCDDDAATTDVAADDAAKARRLAGIELRKKTISSTMTYARTGQRASARVKKVAPKKRAVKKPAAKTPAARKPTTKSKPKKPKAKPPEPSIAPGTAAEAPDKRKRSRTQSQLIARFVDTIDTQLDQIDAIMRDPNRGENGPSEAERHARTVAALARVTVELRKELEAGRRRRADDDSAAGRDQSADPDRSSDPDRPRDLDELRERLSRRLDERLRGGSVVSVGDDAAGGNRLPE